MIVIAPAGEQTMVAEHSLGTFVLPVPPTHIGIHQTGFCTTSRMIQLKQSSVVHIASGYPSISGLVLLEIVVPVYLSGRSDSASQSDSVHSGTAVVPVQPAHSIAVLLVTLLQIRLNKLRNLEGCFSTRLVHQPKFITLILIE